jgi:hypothetical protein
LISLEGLHPELAASVCHHPVFGMMIGHPLVRIRNLNLLFPASGAESCSEFANHCLAEKRDMLATAIIERDWHTYIFAHERPYRFDAIRTLIEDGNATIDDLWPVVGDAWRDSENIHQSTDEWLNLWRSPSRRKRAAMNRADLDTWKALPAKLTIYRGVNCDDEFDAEDAALTGLSWTLSRKKAIWFARRGSSQPYVATGTIFKRHCFAYFSDRNEQEIVVDPDWTNFSLMRVRRARR